VGEYGLRLVQLEFARQNRETDMQLRQIGNTEIRASPIALGTWAIGGGPWWGDSNDKESIRAIHASIDKGVNLIDTAPA